MKIVALALAIVSASALGQSQSSLKPNVPPPVYLDHVTLHEWPSGAVVYFHNCRIDIASVGLGHGQGEVLSFGDCHETDEGEPEVIPRPSLGYRYETVYFRDENSFIDGCILLRAVYDRGLHPQMTVEIWCDRSE